MTNDDENGSRLLQIIGIGAFSLFAVMAAAFTIGFSQAALEHGHSPLEMRFVVTNSIGVLVLIASLAGIYQLTKPMLHRSPNAKPLAQSRAGRMKIFWIALVIISTLVGLGLGVWGILDGRVKITPAMAIAATLIAPPLVWWIDRLYRSNVDELELNAALEASYWSVNAYLIGLPLGWLFWKAGLLTEIPNWEIFNIVIVIYSSIFLWKRFR